MIQVRALDLLPEQIAENEDTVQLLGAAEAEPDVQLLHQNINILGPEYKNDIGLWQNITNEVQDFWCNKNPVECQHFDGDFSASGRQYEDCKRNFSRSMIFRKHVSGE